MDSLHKIWKFGIFSHFLHVHISNVTSIQCMCHILCWRRHSFLLVYYLLTANIKYCLPCFCLTLTIYSISLNRIFYPFVVIHILSSSVSKKKLSYCDARSSLLLCKNFIVAHYSKSIKDINTKLGIFAQQDKVQLQVKGRNSECYIFRVMPFFN